MRKIFKIFFFLILVSSFEVFAQSGDWVTTGSGTRVKKIAFVSVNVYSITHQMKNPPATKSAQAIIDADVEKNLL